jgi:pimeloyl-ACP methyl ester carboxylesterase
MSRFRLSTLAFAALISAACGASGVSRSDGARPAPLAGQSEQQDVTYTLYDLKGEGNPVLLVHGWAGLASEMQYLGEGLRKQGFAPYSVDLRPSDARIADTARAMSKAIDEVLAKEGAKKLILVCHSMGGLDARYYLGMLFGTRKVERLVTIATPHHGTIWGGFAHGEARMDLKPDSEFFRTLDSFGKPLVPTTSIFSWTDQTVVPQNSAILDGATNLEHVGPSHTSILRNPKVLGQVTAALR